jgi:hypothetical protein
MIGCYVDELKEGFFPYVKQVRRPAVGCGCWANCVRFSGWRVHG